MVWFGLILGIVTCSMSAIFIKATDMAPSSLATLRLVFTVCILFPWFWKDYRKQAESSMVGLAKSSLLPGIFLALHFITWNLGVRLTLAAHGTLIVNMVPVVLPVLLWLTHREKINQGEIIATVVSAAGIVYLGVSDYHFSKNHVIGDAICLGSMFLFAGYLSLGRKNRGVASIWLYVVPVYAVAAVVCFVFSLWDCSEWSQYDAQDYLMAFLLAIISGSVGHTLINFSMRHIRGQIVGIVNSGQFLSSGIFAYCFFNESPKVSFYIVSFSILCACILAIVSHQNTEKT